MTKKLFIANWKMYLRDLDAAELAGRFATASISPEWEVAVAPSFTAIERVSRKISGSALRICAQDMYWMDAGAFTGEVSPLSIAEYGVSYVLIGHSERRKYFGETDEMVAKRVAAAVRHDLIPVVCVGESKEEYDAGRREEVVKAQIQTSLAGYQPTSEHPLVIAYEPVWAIGTGVACEPSEASAMHEIIRETVAAMAGPTAQYHTRVLYGGSVDAQNIASYLAAPGVDGILVGRAGTDLDQALSMLSKIS